jgi:hypothetical protein
MRLAHRRTFTEKSTIRIDELAMHAGVDKRTIIMLAVNFDKTASDAAQGLSTHRLIIDEGTGAPIRHLNAA